MKTKPRNPKPFLHALTTALLLVLLASLWLPYLPPSVVAANFTGQARAATVPTPTSVSASSDSMGLAVTVQWDSVSGADHYRVYRSTGPSFSASPDTLLGSSSTVSYRDDAATAGRTLYYRMSAVDASGNESAASSAVSVTTQDGATSNRSKAYGWLDSQQEASQGFRITFDRTYDDTYVGWVSGHVADASQLPGTLSSVPYVAFVQPYSDDYVGTVSGTWANVDTPSDYEVDVYSHTDADYLQGTFELQSDGTWSSGATVIHAGAKRAVLVRKSDGAKVAYSGGGKSVIQGVDVEVYVRTDVDYLQEKVALYSDGSWQTAGIVNVGYKIARLVNTTTNRALNSTEWSDAKSYKGLMRSFYVPFDDPDYGYQGDSSQRAGYRIEQRSWIYDDAVAIYAYTADGEYGRARDILSQLAQLQQPDGSLSFSYDVYRGQIYDLYTRSGALAWVGSAALAYEEKTGDTTYQYFATRIANYLLGLQVTTANGYSAGDSRYGSVLGGVGSYDSNYNFVPGPVTFASTEHNIDAYFFLRDLGYMSGDQRYLDAANLMKQSLLTNHWNSAEGRFNQGVGDSSEPLDVGSWGGLFLLAIGDRAKAQSSEQYVQGFRADGQTIAKSSDPDSYNQTYTGGPVSGYKPYLPVGYTNPPAVVWAEGTFGTLLFRMRLGEDITSDLQSMQMLQAADPNGGFVQVTRGDRPLPYEFHVWPAVGGTGWAALLMSDPSLLWRPDGWIYNDPGGFGSRPTPVSAPQTYGCQCIGMDSKKTSVETGDPVNTATGAVNRFDTDLELASPGVKFKFVRSYTSADTTSGPLGPGWTHSYNESLDIASDGDVTVRTGDGGQIRYIRRSDGSFEGAAGARATLQAASGGYKLSNTDGDYDTFDSNGELTASRDRFSRGLTFAYTNGQLTGITDFAGHQIGLTYSGSLLSQVTLPDGRYVSYTYTAGRLTGVRDARGNSTSYTYDSDGHLATVTDPLGHTVTNTYDSATGRVIKQTDGTGNPTTFS